MKIVSVITARGGSKGIPQKNIVDINGKPLIWYSINASLNSNVNETWVSTEDENIKRVSQECGANVIDRPLELSDDIIMPDAALVHFAQDRDFDIIVFIQPTSPLIKPEYINKGIDMICNNTYDSCFAAVKEHWLPRWDKNINPVGWSIEDRPRRQDRPEGYVEAGMFYITTRDRLLKTKLRYSGSIGIVQIPLIDSVDINSLEDLELVRKII